MSDMERIVAVREELVGKILDLLVSIGRTTQVIDSIGLVQDTSRRFATGQLPAELTDDEKIIENLVEVNNAFMFMHGVLLVLLRDLKIRRDEYDEAEQLLAAHHIMHELDQVHDQSECDNAWAPMDKFARRIGLADADVLTLHIHIAGLIRRSGIIEKILIAGLIAAEAERNGGFSNG